MPNALISVPQKSVTVSRWVTESVIKQIIETTELPSDTIIQFAEKQGHGKQLDSYFKENEDPIRSKYQDIILFNYTERYTENDRRRSVLSKFHHPIFLDKDIGAYVTPVYSEVEVVIEMTVRLRDRTALNAWRSRLHLNDGLHNMIHDLAIDYDFELPMAVMGWITDLYKFRNEIPSASLTMREYMDKTFLYGFGVRTNQSKTHADLIIKERQENVNGSSVDIEYYQDMEDQEGIFQITFPYKFTYQQIQAVRVYTPAVIYNNVLPDVWVKLWCNAIGPLEYDKSFDPYDSLHDMFYNPPEHSVDRYDGGTRMLGWDEWHPELKFDNTQTLTIVPIRVDETTPTLVLNLWNLVDDYLPRGILEYLAEYYDHNGEPFLSYVTIEVYRITDKEELLEHVLDADLNLNVTYAMNPMHRHMVRISVRTSLIEIATAHQEEMLLDAELALKVFKAIDKDVESKLVIYPDNTIQDKSYREWILSLPDTLQSYRDGRTYGDKSVMAFGIKAGKM